MKICVICKSRYPNDFTTCPTCKIVLEFDREDDERLRDMETGY